MDAGKKLDAFVAEHVLEWKNEGGRWLDPSTEEEVALKPFSTDVAAAWDLVDRVCASGFRLQLEGSRLWNARFYKSAAHTLETRAMAAPGGSPAEAICLAALAMKGVSVPK